MYVCHSHFSFNYGLLSPERLVAEAQARGVQTLVLADVLHVGGVFDFVRACRKAGIRPVVGVAFHHQDVHCFTALAFDEAGFAELNRYLSRWLAEGSPLPAPDLAQGAVIFPFSAAVLRRKLGPHHYIGVRAQELGRFAWACRQNPALAYRCLAWQPATFLDRAGYDLHRLLRAIDHNTLLSKLRPEQHAPITQHWPPLQRLHTAYGQALGLLRNADALLARCHFSPNLTAPKNKKTFLGTKSADLAELTRLAWEGFAHRYGSPAAYPEARARLEKELEVIAELDFEAYFLITHDVIRFARHRGYFHVGRGSGANSMAAYCLGISDVDPIELDLYFERFINRHRTSPPDFDIDFSWDERPHVQAYLFERYGPDHVAMMGTLTTYQGRGPIRELGKVFGLPKAEIDALVARPERAQETEIGRQILHYGGQMVDMPCAQGVHAGGILISEQPLYAYTALTPMPLGHPVTHFDMYVAEDIGFAKFDILSQRGLGHIREAVQIIAENRGQTVDVRDVARFKQDEAVRRNIRAAHTIGCFYIESPAMRQLLGKLRCQDYLTLVAASSIIRPGVAKSGMMRAYIERLHDPAKIQYTHPDLQPLLAETYGVMVYQEDVIKVAHHFAGMDLADADILRRGMSGKYRSRLEFDRVRDTYFQLCAAKGYDHAAAAEVWRQIESFSGYSFSKAHSASFAVESYQSLYLKTHWPLEFAVAVVNNFGGFYRTEIYVNECRRAGGQIEAPCVNRSRYKTWLQGTVVWLGFIHVLGLEAQVAERLLAERTRNGPFAGLEDFCARVRPGLEQTLLLIRAGALRCFGADKKALMWDAQALHAQKTMRAPVAAQLFATPVSAYALPALSTYRDEDAYDQIELLGFPLCSPFALLAEPDRLQGTLPVRQMPEHLGRTVRMVGYLVCTKGVRTVRGEGMCFGCFLDADSDFLDTVHFPPTLAAWPFRGPGLYELQGTVTEEFGVYALEVSRMERLFYRPDPRVKPLAEAA